MRIAIIGAGNVGGALGQAFTAAGHEVVFGVRDPESTKTLAALAAIPDAEAVDPPSAVEGADVIVFALRWDAVPSTIAALPSLAGRVVIDASNRFDGEPGSSVGLDIARLLPGARLVKAFNTTGFENYLTARERKVPAAMFVAGDDAAAKGIALRLATEIGFEAEDAGPLSNARALEEMVRVWVQLTKAHGRGIAFALSRE